MPSKWFFAENGQQSGPIELNDLRARLSRGELAAQTLVWREGMAQWVAAERVAELALTSDSSGAPPIATIATSGPPPRPPVGAAPSTAPTIAYQQPGAGAVLLTPRSTDLLNHTAPWARLLAIILFIIGGMAGIGGVFVAVVVGASAFGLARGESIGVVALISFMYLCFAAMLILPGFFLNRFASRLGELRRTAREDKLEQALAAQKSFLKTCGICVLTIIGLYVLLIVVMVGVSVLA